jgi:hypothetical protein
LTTSGVCRRRWSKSIRLMSARFPVCRRPPSSKPKKGDCLNDEADYKAPLGSLPADV